MRVTGPGVRGKYRAVLIKIRAVRIKNSLVSIKRTVSGVKRTVPGMKRTVGFAWINPKATYFPGTRAIFRAPFGRR